MKRTTLNRTELSVALIVIVIGALFVLRQAAIDRGLFPERIIAFGRVDDLVETINPVNDDAAVGTYHKARTFNYILLSTTRSGFVLGLNYASNQAAEYGANGTRLLVETYPKRVVDYPCLNDRPIWTLYDAHTLAPLWSHAATPSEYDGSAIADNGKLLALSNGAAVDVWDIVSRRLVEEIPSQKVVSVAFSPDNKRLAVTGPLIRADLRQDAPGFLDRTDPLYDPKHLDPYSLPPGYFAVWDLDSGKRIWQKYIPSWSASLQYSPDGRFLGEAGDVGYWQRGYNLVGGWRTGIIVDANTGDLRWAPPLMPGVSFQLPQYVEPVFAPNSKYAALIGFDRTSLIDLKTMQTVRTYYHAIGNAHPYATFTPDSNHLICGSGGHLSEYYLGGI